MSDSLSPRRLSTPGSSVLHCLTEFAQTHAPLASDVIQLSHPLPPSSPFSLFILNFSQEQSFPMSQFFASGGQSTGASVSASVLLVIDWSDLLAVQGTLKGLLQHHSSKTLILWHSAFFMSDSHICT